MPSFIAETPCNVCGTHESRLTHGRRQCIECKRRYDRERYRSNPEPVKQRTRAARRADPEAKRAYNKKWAAENAERMAGYFRKRYERDKAKILAEAVRRDRLNPAGKRARVARYRATKASATPQWVDQRAINEFYREAQRLTTVTGVTYSVDHIVPIRSRKVCGLHVPWNLRVIPALDNARKGATFDTDA